MPSDYYLFTSESVSMGHPDKVADQISDGVLDHCLKADPLSRVACETLVTTDLAVVAGEVTSNADLSAKTVESIAREVIREALPQLLAPADDTAVLLHKANVLAAGGVRLGAEAGATGERRLVLHHLAKRRAAMTLAVD